MDIRTFYKYKTINEYTLDSLKNKYFYYSQQKQLDDPFDMYTPVDILEKEKEIRELFKRYPDLAKIYTVDSYRKKQKEAQTDEDYHKRFLESTQMFHVLCLTPVCDNDVMWALYANNYKGIAIGYKVGKESNNYFISLGKKREINHQRKFLLEQGCDRFYENPDLRIILTPVIYDLSKIKRFNLLMDNYEEMLENEFIKKTLWSFEKEFRSVIISPEHRDKHLKIYYPDEALSEIIFGYKTPDTDIKKVIDLVKKEYANIDKIKFFKIVPNINKSMLEKKTLVFIER
ncbi:MAG: DUF2971 domain-containing protein [Spirochaetaceae bacterium]|nr:DUF2971 domain-containing protein [Spirochaetaceae bacterium]